MQARGSETEIKSKRSQIILWFMHRTEFLPEYAGGPWVPTMNENSGCGAVRWNPNERPTEDQFN